MPPTYPVRHKGAPTEAPIHPAEGAYGPGVVAPWPLIDRYPTILGSSVSVAYIGSQFRQCLAGYRAQYVDLLNELLERAPHAYACLSQRFLTTAGGRVEVTPRKLRTGPDGKPHPLTDKAKEIADDIAAELAEIPSRTQALLSLLWGIYYGVGGLENLCDRDGDGWHIVGLQFLSSRRLAYPDQDRWYVRLWDQGAMMISGGAPLGFPSQALFGAPVHEFPNKFVIHAPQIRGDYPTREGLGRQLAFLLGIEGLILRGVPEFIERYAKPWAFGYYQTGSKETEFKPRTANDADIAQLDAALSALGLGGLASAVLPDSTKIELMGPGVTGGKGAGALTHLTGLEAINKEIGKVILTTSGLQDVGSNGSRSALSEMREGFKGVVHYDATCLAETIERDIVAALVRLRHPGYEHLRPSVTIHVEERPDPEKIIRVAAQAAAANAPIDARAIAEQAGLPLVPNLNPEMEPMRPLKPTPPTVGDMPIESAAEVKARFTEPETVPLDLPRNRRRAHLLNAAA